VNVGEKNTVLLLLDTNFNGFPEVNVTLFFFFSCFIDLFPHESWHPYSFQYIYYG